MKKVLKSVLITLIIMSVTIAIMIVSFHMGGTLLAVIMLIAVLAMLFVGVYYVVSYDDIEEKKEVCKTVWLVVNKCGDKWFFTKSPIRTKSGWYANGGKCVYVSGCAIETVIGRKPTWDDEPLEITIKNKAYE